MFYKFQLEYLKGHSYMTSTKRGEEGSQRFKHFSGWFSDQSWMAVDGRVGGDPNFQLFCRFHKSITPKKNKATRLSENIRLIYGFQKIWSWLFFVGIDFRKTEQISRYLIKLLPVRISTLKVSKLIRKRKADLPCVVKQNF